MNFAPGLNDAARDTNCNITRLNWQCEEVEREKEREQFRKYFCEHDSLEQQHTYFGKVVHNQHVEVGFINGIRVNGRNAVDRMIVRNQLQLNAEAKNTHN